MLAISIAKLLRPYITSIHGRDFLPNPPYILVANHVSPLDPALLLAATHAPIRFLAAGHLFQRGWGVIRLYNELALRKIGNVIPTGPGSIVTSVRALHAGGIVGIFPEGDIHPVLNQHRLHAGLAYIAQQANVPVVPVRIQGSEHVWRFTKNFAPWRLRAVSITIGEKIKPPTAIENRASAQAFVAAVMQGIATL